MSIEEDLIKKLPIDKLYEDLLQPSLKQLGVGIGDIVELAFAPFDLLAAKKRIRLKEHLRKYEEKTKSINAEDQVPIPDEFGIPILRKLAETNQEELSDKYLNLLTKASSLNELENVHPRYIKLLDSLSLDEILIIDKLGTNFKVCGHLIIAPSAGHKPKALFGLSDKKSSPYLTFDILTDHLRFKNKLPIYLENLVNLGVHEFSADWRTPVGPLGPPANVEDKHALFQLLKPYYDEARAYAVRMNYHEVYLETGYFHLTRFGKTFYKACSPIN